MCCISKKSAISTNKCFHCDQDSSNRRKTMTRPTISLSGDPIFRYGEHAPEHYRLTVECENYSNAVESHIRKHIGKSGLVFREFLSKIVHINVHWIKPCTNYPFHVLVTSGMSSKPMNIPQGLDNFRYAELCILLPDCWKIGGVKINSSEEFFGDERSYWPLRWLKTVARFPHEYYTWIGGGHTVQFGDNLSPFASDTKLSSMLLLESVSLPPEFSELMVDNKRIIKFYCLYPIYKEEMHFRLNHGIDALLDKFSKFNVSDVLDIKRPNTCLR